jgi:hypothetical protein
MSKARLRPRYRYVSQKPKKEILHNIGESLKQNNVNLEGQVIQEHAFIRIPEKKQHYWSPELHIWVREEDTETVIFGVMGPKPKIWTMFMFFYTAVLTLWFFGSSYGLIQLWLAMKAPFLWSIPAGFIGTALVYGAAQWGQYKGKEQMEILQEFIESAIVV